jgi:hypothetical protein
LNPERDDDVIMVDLEEDKLKKHIVEEAKISRNSGF